MTNMRAQAIRCVVIVELILICSALVFLLSIFFRGSVTSDQQVPPDVIVLNDLNSAEQDYSYLLAGEALVAVRYTPKPRASKPEPVYFVCRGDDLHLARSTINELLASDELLTRPIHPGESVVLARFGYFDKPNGSVSIKREQRFKLDPDGPNMQVLRSLRVTVCVSANQVDHVPPVLSENKLMKYLILTEKFPN